MHLVCVADSYSITVLRGQRSNAKVKGEGQSHCNIFFFHFTTPYRFYFLFDFSRNLKKIKKKSHGGSSRIAKLFVF